MLQRLCGWYLLHHCISTAALAEPSRAARVEVVSPATGVLVRGDELTILLRGHSVNESVDWLSIVDLNAPLDGPSFLPYTTAFTLSFDQHVIGTLIYDIYVIIGGHNEGIQPLLGPPTRIYYELVWEDEHIRLNQGSQFYFSPESNSKILDLPAMYTRFPLQTPPSFADNVGLELNDPSNNITIIPINVVHLMSGSFDGQKQVMIKQWDSIDKNHVIFSVIWSCDSILRPSDGPMDIRDENNMTCHVDHDVATAIRAHKVKVVFWEPFRLKNINRGEKPPKGESYEEYYLNTFLHGNLQNNNDSERSENDEESEEVVRDESDRNYEESERNQRIEKNEHSNDDENNDKNEDENSNIIEIEKVELFSKFDHGAICIYLVMRLRSTEPKRKIEKITPLWARAFWTEMVRSMKNILPSDIIVLGNGGNANDMILPEIGLILGINVILLDIASSANKPNKLFEYHSVISPSLYALQAFPYEPIRISNNDQILKYEKDEGRNNFKNSENEVLDAAMRDDILNTTEATNILENTDDNSKDEKDVSNLNKITDKGNNLDEIHGKWRHENNRNKKQSTKKIKKSGISRLIVPPGVTIPDVELMRENRNKRESILHGQRASLISNVCNQSEQAIEEDIRLNEDCHIDSKFDENAFHLLDNNISSRKELNNNNKNNTDLLISGNSDVISHSTKGIYDAINHCKDKNLKDENRNKNENIESCLVVGFLGRLVSPKGPGMFLLMAKNVLQELPTTIFLLAGSGPLLEPLKQLSVDLKIEKNVRFIGHVKQSDIFSVYVLMDVYVTPSLMPSETFGITSIEAMSMSVPVVTFGTYGQQEYLDPIYFSPETDDTPHICFTSPTTTYTSTSAGTTSCSTTSTTSNSAPHSRGSSAIDDLNRQKDTVIIEENTKNEAVEYNRSSHHNNSTSDINNNSNANDKISDTCHVNYSKNIHKNSIVVTTATPQALASGVILLLKNPNLREKISTNGLKIVREKYTTKRNGESMLNVYRTLMA